MELLNRFKEQLKEISYLSHAYNLMYWDLQTKCPKGGKEKLSDGIAFFSTEIFKKTTSDDYYEMVCRLSEPGEYEKLNEAMQFHVTKQKRDLEKMRRIPADFYEEYVRTTTKSSVVWAEAKNAKDYSLYEKPLEDTIEAVKKYQAYANPDMQAYDALIDQFEEGMTQETIDRVFSELKERLVPLVERILSADQPDHSKFTMTIPKHEQDKLCMFLIEYMGMDMDRFTSDETEHPFTMAMSINDVRITNHYYENEVISAIFSAIHEGGHALFEQNMKPEYIDTEAAVVNYMGLHESQSRFYENVLGRNINFWKPIWPKVCEIVPEFKAVSLEEFVREINHVSNSFIRTEADELTYCLHIILRYEMEKAIFIDGAKAADLPKLWNQKMEELLHIVPSNDAEGILQDMHWSDGSFGYFPSYLLGSIYDGMFIETIEEELGSIDEILASGDIKKITGWLKDNIHWYGATRTSDIVLEKVCKKPLSAKPIADYFERKYAEIYNI